MKDIERWQVVAEADGDDVIVPLPPEVVERLGAQIGDEWELRAEDEHLVLIPVRAVGPHDAASSP